MFSETIIISAPVLAPASIVSLVKPQCVCASHRKHTSVKQTDMRLCGSLLNPWTMLSLANPVQSHIYKKAQQRLFHLRQLKKFRVRSQLLLRFCTATVQGVLTSSIMVWFGSLETLSRKKLQCISN